MSLLLKALEKAAKDREDGTGAPATPASQPPSGTPGGAADAELTLEPITVQPATAAAAAAPTPPPRDNAAAAPSKTAAPRDSAQAAALIRAAGQHENSGGLFSFLRDRPLVVFGVLAGVFLLGFGGYVYVQMNPAMFMARAPRPATSAPVAQPPAPAPVPAPQASGASGTIAAPQKPVALSSLAPPPAQAGAKEKAVPQPRAAAAAAPAPEPAPVPAPTAPRDTIKVTSGAATPTVNPLLTEAYSALTAGNFESSRRLYSQLVISDPGNIEALLGLAAIATQQGDRDTAAKHYVRVIELDPRNSFAQAGLIGMLGRADPRAAETRVKQLIARDPSAAYLHFTLGNTYVDQSRWPDAQQAFFQAYHLQPDHADYAYNLAVALEHVGQPKPALDFYRRAVLLATAKGRANFSTAAAQERVARLEKIVP